MKRRVSFVHGRASASGFLTAVALVFAAVSLGCPSSRAADLASHIVTPLGPAGATRPRYFTVNLRAGATAQDATSVADYFRGFGLTVDSRGGILFVRGTNAQAAAAGHTAFERAAVGGAEFERAASVPVFPPAIGEEILATTLGGGPPAGGTANVVHHDFTLLPTYGYTPAALATFYDAGSLYSGGTNGAGENLALVACDTYLQSDLTAFESIMGLPNNTPTVVPVDGGSKTIAFGPTLDVEDLVGAAPGSSITLYVAPSNPSSGLCTLAELADQFAAIAADMSTKHYVAVSNPGLATEDYYASTGSGADMSATSADIQTIVNAGGTVFAGSGISGAGPPGPETLSAGEFTVGYPASDPNAIGVGGTAAIPQSASNFTRFEELGWGGSGGGVSVDFTIPTFQKHLKGEASTTVRNVPDVAFDASVDTSVACYYKGGETAANGTAIGTDYWSGFIALVDQSRTAAGKKPLKQLAGKLYAARRTAGNFLRITRGCNGYYCASVKEYNNVTGLGVPDVAKLVAYLVGLP